MSPRIFGTGKCSGSSPSTGFVLHVVRGCAVDPESGEKDLTSGAYPGAYVGAIPGVWMDSMGERADVSAGQGPCGGFHGRSASES